VTDNASTNSLQDFLKSRTALLAGVCTAVAAVSWAACMNLYVAPRDYDLREALGEKAAAEAEVTALRGELSKLGAERLAIESRVRLLERTVGEQKATIEDLRAQPIKTPSGAERLEAQRLQVVLDRLSTEVEQLTADNARLKNQPPQRGENISAVPPPDELPPVFRCPNVPFAKVAGWVNKGSRMLIFKNAVSIQLYRVSGAKGRAPTTVGVKVVSSTPDADRQESLTEGGVIPFTLCETQYQVRAARILVSEERAYFEVSPAS